MADTHFPLPLQGEFLGNGRAFLLTAPFVFVDNGEEITVPAGFSTDFNSVPRGLWNLFPPWEHPEAGVIHDYIYRYPDGRTRGDCDFIHRRVLELKGMSRWRRWLIWTGIKSGGWLAWRGHRKGDKYE